VADRHQFCPSYVKPDHLFELWAGTWRQSVVVKTSPSVRRATGSQDRRAATCPQRIRLVPPWESYNHTDDATGFAPLTILAENCTNFWNDWIGFLSRNLGKFGKFVKIHLWNSLNWLGASV
jgi:hypothetical protein